MILLFPVIQAIVVGIGIQRIGSIHGFLGVAHTIIIIIRIGIVTHAITIRICRLSWIQWESISIIRDPIAIGVWVIRVSAQVLFFSIIQAVVIRIRIQWIGAVQHFLKIQNTVVVIIVIESIRDAVAVGINCCCGVQRESVGAVGLTITIGVWIVGVSAH